MSITAQPCRTAENSLERRGGDEATRQPIRSADLQPFRSTSARALVRVGNKQHHTLKQKFEMNSSFENKVALITGAGSGMGLVTARAFAEAGAAVALADVNENAVRSAAEELVSAGHKAIGIRCNVADEAEVAAMVAQT